MGVLKTISIILIILMLSGCGRVVESTSNDNIDNNVPTIVIDGNVKTTTGKLVNANVIGDQKNCNIARLNDDLLIVTFIDEETFRIVVCWYNNNFEKLDERRLYMEHAITDGRPGICRYKEGFLICFESLDGEYLGYYDIAGNKLMNEVKILNDGQDDCMMEQVDSENVMIVYESNTGNTNNKDIYTKLISVSLNNNLTY